MIIISYILIFVAVVLLAAAFIIRPKLQVSVPKTNSSKHRVFKFHDTTDDDKARMTSPKAMILQTIGSLISNIKRQSQAARQQPIHYGSDLTVVQFQGLKVVTAVLAMFVFAVIGREFGFLGPIGLLISAIVGFMLPTIWLRSRIHSRNQAILRLLPEAIDILSLCVGAGMDFLGAMNRVVGAKRSKEEPLIQEMSTVLKEIRLGRRRVEALKAMSARVNLPELTSFVRTFVQADKMGTPISEALSMHSEDVRIERFNRAERNALKAPVKILVPLVFFILPCVGIIIGAPIFFQFAQANILGR